MQIAQLQKYTVFPHVDELQDLHQAYWRGVRYHSCGRRVKAATSGDPRGAGGPGSGPRGDGRSLVSGATEYADLGKAKRGFPRGEVSARRRR